MAHRSANNASAMRAACGRPSANREIEFVLSCVAALAVAGVAVALTGLAVLVAGTVH